MLVYLNGEYLPHSEARVSVEDRGFLFADGVYEVARVYDGRIFLLDEHLQRLANGLAAIEIAFAGVRDFADVAERLLHENELRNGDATIYIQVTRGAAPRKHAFPPAGTPPTVYMAARPFTQHPPAYFAEGVSAITAPDTRWTRCDIKSVSLLPNILANQRAKAAGAFEALFVRDGIVAEGSHSNLFAVVDGALVTYPASNYILSGITRRLVFDLAAGLDLTAREGPIPLERLYEADELFLSGTTTEIMPVVTVDGRTIADGRPGSVTRRLLRRYREQV